jgi:transposase
MISTLEAERNAIVEDQASTHPNAKKIQTLHKLKAIGPEFAAVLVGEIFHRDFNNRRQLASYVGYAPSPFQSGKLAHDQGISKAGNRKGRTTGIELAWLWLRYQPDSDLSVWFRTRVGATKGRIRRITIVAFHASYSWRSGVTLKLARCHKVPSSKGEKRGPIREDYEI